MKRSVVVVALVAGLLLSVAPTAFGAGVVHRVSVGSADIVELPGQDANFSLVATEAANGTVRGEWHDQFGGRGVPAEFEGDFVHITITCLEVDGNDAWVSGLVTAASSDLDFLVGLPAITQVRDNGSSANDPADQVSFTNIDSGFDCDDKPELPLFDLVNGQAKVQ